METPLDYSDWLTTKEVAKMLQTSRSHIYNLLRKEKINSVKYDGYLRRWDPADIKKLMAKRPRIIESDSEDLAQYIPVSMAVKKYKISLSRLYYLIDLGAVRRARIPVTDRFTGAKVQVAVHVQDLQAYLKRR